MTRSLSLIIAILFIFAFFSKANAQSYSVSFYTEQNGLMNSAVWNVTQDNDGKMWFSTRAGISVYDGLNWSSHRYLYGSSGADNIKLKKDETGKIWVVLRKKNILISNFNNSAQEEVYLSDGDYEHPITSFIVDTLNSQRFILVGCLNGDILYFYNNTWKKLSLTDIDNKEKIETLNEAARYKDKIALATNRGLFYFFPDGTIEKSDFKNKGSIKGVCFEIVNGKERLLLAGETWFGYLEDGNYQEYTNKIIATYDPNSPYLNIIPDKHGGYFLGNEFTLIYYSTFRNTLTNLGILNGLISGGMNSVFVDTEKNIWIPTYRGVSKIYNRTFVNYRNAFFSYENEISSLIEYEPGEILFGGNFGLSLYKGSEYKYIPLLDSSTEAKGHIRVLDLYKDRGGVVWVASHLKGFYTLDKNLKRESFNIKHKNIIGMATSVAQDENGDMWLSTNKHLYLYNGKEVSIAKGFPENCNVRKIIKLRDNNILFCAVGSGIYLKAKDKIINYTSSDVNYLNVFSAYQLKDGRILLGTVGGLCEIKNGSISKTTINNNLTIDRPIYLILGDNDKNLWLGTDLGVIKYDGEKLDYYTIKDGFAGSEVNRSGGVVDANGRVWFGTNNGASCYYKEFDVKKDTVNPISPNIIFINTNNEKNPAKSGLEFSHNENNITFIINGSSFINEKENKLRWALEGLEENWSSENAYYSDQIFYKNLPSGMFRLKVQLKNANGVWGPVTYSPWFKVNKPYYLRWWFLLFSVILFSGVVYSVLHYFEQRKYNKFLKLEVEKTSKELRETEKNHRETLIKEIHHRVKNNMQVISSLLSLQANQENNAHLNEIIKESQNRIRSMALIHEKLYQSKKYSELDIYTYVVSLIENLKRTFLINTSTISVDLDIEKTYINIDTAIACGLIINELVSNSLKYAFPENSKGVIFVKIHIRGSNILHLSVGDNGIGLGDTQKIEETDSLGLKLVKMLVKQHSGDIKINGTNGTLFEINLTIKDESNGQST